MHVLLNGDGRHACIIGSGRSLQTFIFMEEETFAIYNLNVCRCEIVNITCHFSATAGCKKYTEVLRLNYKRKHAVANY